MEMGTQKTATKALSKLFTMFKRYLEFTLRKGTSSKTNTMFANNKIGFFSFNIRII